MTNGNHATKKNRWFRLYAEFAFDPKVQSISETFQRRYIMLLCLKCNGDLENVASDELACALRIDEESLAETKKVFMEKGFIDENWALLNWDKRQYVSDSSTERVRAHRAKKKKRNCNVSTEKSNVSIRKRNVTVTPPDTETDIYNSNELLSSPIQACPQTEIVALYHAMLPELPQVKSWSPPRQKLLRARWKEDAERQDLAWWRDLFATIRRCSHLLGHNDRGWVADLEWIVRPKNFVKILEGRYLDRATKAPGLSALTPGQPNKPIVKQFPREVANG